MPLQRVKAAETDLNRVRKINALIDQANGVGTTGSVASASGVTASHSSGGVFKTVLTLTNTVITMTDAGAAGSHGTLKVMDFPAGNIAFLGATTDLAIVAGAGGITDTAAVVGGVGTATVGTGDATLTTTEQDLVPSTAATLTAGAGAFDGQSLTANIAVFDGTTTPIDAWLNFAVPDAGSTANDTLTVNGTITLVWSNLGDN